MLFRSSGVDRVHSLRKIPTRLRARTFALECTRSTPLDPKLMFWYVSYHLGAFWTVWLPHETRCKMGRTSAKVRATKCVGIFCNERIRSTPLHHKLTFSCILYNLGAFVTVWLPYETRCKTSRASAKLCATNSRWNFSQRTHPIHPIAP